jgi:hypothetical protein
MQIQAGNINADTLLLRLIACCPRHFKQLHNPNQSDWQYSFMESKQTSCDSQIRGWQPNLTMNFVCTPLGDLGWQQPDWQHLGVNYFYSMKNPRKSPDRVVSTITRGLKNVKQNLADLPFLIEPEPDTAPQEKHSPEEESFRSLLHQSLSRRAPQALRERIKNKIKNMPD